MAINKVMVLGAGTMGMGIAQVSLRLARPLSSATSLMLSFSAARAF